jgi:hypothetical protein
LKEYLESRENAIHGLEVVTIMMSLFDEEEIMKSFIRSERHDAKKEQLEETAKNMIKAGRLSTEDISMYTSLPLDVVNKLKEEMMQLV